MAKCFDPVVIGYRSVTKQSTQQPTARCGLKRIPGCVHTLSRRVAFVSSTQAHARGEGETRERVAMAASVSPTPAALHRCDLVSTRSSRRSYPSNLVRAKTVHLASPPLLVRGREKTEKTRNRVDRFEGNERVSDLGRGRARATALTGPVSQDQTR